MKRFWLVLLSLGLIVSFSTAAMAVDVLVGGEFYVGGMYIDKTSLVKGSDVSTAFYYQRLRLDANFVVSPGLNLITRLDIMERQWGATRSAPGTTTVYGSAGTRAENENIAFDYMYAQYTSPIGMFSVGAMEDYAWGTVFGNRAKPSLKIAYITAVGPALIGAQIIKEGDSSASAVNIQGTTVNNGAGATNPFTDGDADGYLAFIMYKMKIGMVGYLFRYNRTATGKPSALGLTANLFSHVPYFKFRFGPVSLEGEATYLHGTMDYNMAAYGLYPTAQVDSWEAYLNADADFGIAYVNATFAYLGGQINPGEANQVYVASAGQFVNHARRTGLLTGGTDWNPCLILWNYERSYFGGAISGNTTDGNGFNPNGMQNAYFFQIKGGVRPVDKLDINLSVSYANAVVKPQNPATNLYYQHNDYGWEVDATATYRITNNLSYMLGAGYLFTGKYFKGAYDPTTSDPQIQDDYLLINKLTLTF